MKLVIKSATSRHNLTSQRDWFCVLCKHGVLDVCTSEQPILSAESVSGRSQDHVRRNS